MKILHIMSCGISSGAGRGAYWLHLAQRKHGVESYLLTSGASNGDNNYVVSLSSTVWGKVKFRLLSKLGKLPVRLYFKRKKWIFNTGIEGVDITKLQIYKDADIIHLHWTTGLIQTRNLRKIKKPIVWTIRDMWPLTGGCHISMGCEKYRTGCGRCPQLGSSKKLDLSRLVVKSKSRGYPDNIRVVCISQWLADCAKESELLSGYDIEVISNNINTNDFSPVATDFARSVLGLPENKNIILIGALSVSAPWKGFDLFLESLSHESWENSHFLFFGNITENVLLNKGIEYTNLGYLGDLVSLRLAYSAADVFVAPSQYDAFGKTLAESMACGTPVVCFDATGPKDIVEHKQTGYKAKAYDPSDLAAGIRWVLDCSSSDRKRISENSRSRVRRLFDSEVIAKKYLKIYSEMIAKNTCSNNTK